MASDSDTAIESYRPSAVKKLPSDKDVVKVIETVTIRSASRRRREPSQPVKEMAVMSSVE